MGGYNGKEIKIVRCNSLILLKLSLSFSLLLFYTKTNQFGKLKLNPIHEIVFSCSFQPKSAKEFAENAYFESFLNSSKQFFSRWEMRTYSSHCIKEKFQNENKLNVESKVKKYFQIFN